MDNAFKWIEKNGICTEPGYPYTSGSGSSGTCKTTCAKAVTLTGFTDVPNEGAMLAALAKGPVSVAIEADQFAFQGYTGGVITKGCGTSLDHGVLAVGYGTESGQDYFLVKNSWGPSWGDHGYTRIGTDDVCGILEDPSYPMESVYTPF